jgi:hypothetical protein
MEMTKEQKIELIREVVPDMILESAKECKWFSGDASEIEDIKSFEGDIFKEYVSGKIENNEYVLGEEEAHGGYEGAGEEMWVVYSLTSKVDGSKIYFELNGWYNSWDSNEWERDFSIVIPQEVMKIVWRKV